MFNIVTICGSFKFEKEMLEEKARLEKHFDIVHMPNTSFTKEDIAGMDKLTLEILHKVHNLKMSNSDYVLVVNPNGYIGKDTQREIDYALDHNIEVKYTDPVNKMEPNKIETNEDLSKFSNQALIDEIEKRVANGKLDISVEFEEK